MTTIVAREPSLKPAQVRFRIEGIDFLRGLVMIIMALDHTRDMIHSQAFTDDPLNLQTTTPLLFFTRWITHFCAPVFVFLSGTSIYLQSMRKDKKTLSSFVIKRGLWLILAELTIITLGITFDIYFSTFVLQVIWSIGISMVILGLLIHLPFRTLLALGLIIVIGHNLLDYYETTNAGNLPVWYDFLHHPALTSLWKGHSLLIFYPFLPWTGLMILGYCFGSIYKNPDKRAIKKLTIALGLAVISVFLIVRTINLYGDPLHWSYQKTSLYTFLSFLNTQKYPPSLLYMCMTIGPALVFLGIFGTRNTRLTKVISVYGSVPFFYYIIHFYVLHLITSALFLLRGHTISEGIKGTGGNEFRFIIPGEGYSLGTVYLVWICVVIALYPVCKWYSNYKKQHSHWWLSYL